ncbi:hypothetical protein Daus18300_000338 [Diaporthe australafricana]|uniref:Uncharacterized protein n=1 Tax=Diaporthe australafricana TaxID=127596 RepID=A0ABR3Y5R6_9PEZI
MDYITINQTDPAMEHEFSTTKTTVATGDWTAGAAWEVEDELTASAYWGGPLLIPDSDWGPGVCEDPPCTPTQEWVSGPQSTSSDWNQQESTNDCKALVQAKHLTSATSQIPAYQQKMSGRLIATSGGGVLFFPVGTRRGQIKRSIYETLRFVDMLEEEPSEEEMLNIAKAHMSDCKTGAPRFLFRGFHPMSGGGGDSRLNSTAGVVPHGFLGGKMAMNMWDIPNLAKMANMHLNCDPDVISDFSSWSHCLDTAVGFARWEEGSMIAVLDTASMADHVWFSNDLMYSGMADVSFSDEYLVYGPVSGANYHCVSPQVLYSSARMSEITSGDMTGCGEDPYGLWIQSCVVDSAREVATVLQPSSASIESLVILTTKFVARRVNAVLYSGHLDYDHIDAFLYYMRDDIQALAMRMDGDDISLVDETMDTSHSWELVFEIQLIQAVENAVRALALEIRETFSRILADTDSDYPEEWEGAEEI